MLFTPHVKNKRCTNINWNVQPFVTSNNPQGLYDSTFTGISVEISDGQGITDLFNNGFYGKGSHSRSVPSALVAKSAESQLAHVNETLSLSLEEAFFLSYYLKILRIRNIFGDELMWKDFLLSAQQLNYRFLECLASYIYLKSKGWVVKSGLKFAGNFLVYRKGPRFYHASFVVVILPSCKHLHSRSLKCWQRIAETSDKDILILEVSRPTNYRMEVIEDIMQLHVSESIIRRFNYTSFIQQAYNKID